MRFKAFLLLVLAAVVPLAVPHAANARADVSFDYFYDALRPYGEWIEVDGYGLCWQPAGVDPDWTPYSDGYWAYTDAGWTWVGYEEFAGIVYHYGRWVNLEEGGWCWVPDSEWAPAWVSWRSGDDYVGWAPLPPRAYWQPEIGIGTWVDTECDIGPDFYNFCHWRDFGAPVLRMVIARHASNFTIIRHTVNVTNMTYNSYGSVPVIYNGGPAYAAVSRVSTRPIPVLKLVRNTRFDRTDFRGGRDGFSPNARTVGNQLIVNAPIVAPPVQPALLKERVKRVFAADKVQHGWSGVPDGKARDELRQQLQRETKGLTPYTAPARAVTAGELKAVPVQADPRAVSPALTGKDPRGKGERQPPALSAEPAISAPPTKPRIETPRPITGGVLKPFDQDTAKTPRNEDGTDPRATDKPMRTKTANDAPPGGFHPPAGVTPAITHDSAPARPARTSPVADPAVAQAQAAAEAAKAAREQAKVQQQKRDEEKLRAAQAEAEKARSEQERISRQRDAEAAKKLQLGAQRQQAQMEQQRAAQEAAKQQALEHARALKAEQQRAAQDAAKQQALQQRPAEKEPARASQPAQQSPPPSPNPHGKEKGKDKDKDKDKGT